MHRNDWLDSDLPGTRKNPCTGCQATYELGQFAGRQDAEARVIRAAHWSQRWKQAAKGWRSADRHDGLCEPARRAEVRVADLEQAVAVLAGLLEEMQFGTDSEDWMVPGYWEDRVIGVLQSPAVRRACGERSFAPLKDRRESVLGEEARDG